MAEIAFKQVFENGSKIELDHYIIYYGRTFFLYAFRRVLSACADFEYGRLLARSGDKEGAKVQFDIVLSGKPLEVNAAGRKGKYSLEVCSLNHRYCLLLSHSQHDITERSAYAGACRLGCFGTESASLNHALSNFRTSRVIYWP